MASAAGCISVTREPRSQKAAITHRSTFGSAMPLLPLRPLPDRGVSVVAQEWLADLSARLDDPQVDRSLLCRRTLTDICYPEYAANWETAVMDTKVPRGTRIALSAMDPRNVTLEPEYYADCDDLRFQHV